MNNWKLRHSFTGNATSDVQTVNGYLADPAFSLHTNLVDYSEGLSAFAGGVTETLAPSEVDPTGNSGTVVETSNFQGATGDRQQLNIVVVDEANRGKDFTGSMYVKGTSGETITYRIKRTTATATFVGSPEVGLTFDGTWQRIEASMTSLADTLDCSFYLINKAGDTADTFLVWGGQIEQGDAASPYIKTDGAPVTLPNTFNVTVVPDGKEYAAPLFIPRTNLLLQSNQFDTTWTSNNTTETGGQAGYDGTSDGWLLDKTAANGETRQSVDAGLRTFSLYAKAGSLSWLYLLKGGNAGQYFNLGTGVLGSPTGTGGNVPLDAKIEDVGGGWYRCSMTYNDLYAGSLRIYPADGDNDTSGTSGNIYIQDAQLQTGSVATEYIPTTTAAVTRDWSAFGRVQNQIPGICNGTHTHTGAASDSGIAATTITGIGSGATFAYEFDTLGVLTTLTADGAGSGYKVGDKLSIDTTEEHTIEFRLVEGSNAATVSVSMGAAKPNKPVPFPVSKMRVEGLTDRTVLFLDRRSQYVFPKPTPYLLDTYEGAAAAYSLRRLRSSYTGPAVRVRRASNNDELDIYFNRDGSLDTATLEAFCAGTNGFVSVWYDQGQEGNDVEQTTTANQPKIVSSGSVVTENGQPALDFDSSFLNCSVTSGDILSTNAENTMVAVMTQDGTSPQNCLVHMLSPRYVINADYFSTLFYDAGNGTTNRVQATIPSGWDDTQHLLFWSSSLTLQQICVDGVQLASDTSQVTVASNVTTLQIGRRVEGYDPYKGKVQEVILYGSDESANRTAIEDNINEHYGIYEFSGLLDDYSGAAAAYSLRRLSSTYTGPAIRVVKHDVGYPEMDVPFEDDGTLSVVLLEAFADGYDATVKIWYDQSGGSNDAEQSTLANQPKIVSAGTVITNNDNGLPVLQGVTDNYFNLSSAIIGSGDFSIYTASTRKAADMLYGGDSPRYGIWAASTNVLRSRFANPTTQIDFSGTLPDDALFLSYFNRSGNTAELAANGATAATATLVSSNDITVQYLLVGNGTVSFNYEGQAFEFVFYNSDQSANRTGIESNINDFYSIYP